MSTTIPDVNNPEKKIARLVRARYGKYSYIDDIQEDKGEYDISIGIRLPRKFYDEKEESMYYKHIEMENIATAVANYKNNSIRIDLPDVEVIEERLNGHIEALRSKIKDRLVLAAGDKLLELPGVPNDFSKVRKILRLLRVEGKISETDLKGNNNSRYLELLDSLDYLDENNGFYVESDHLKELYNDDGEEVCDIVIEDIITNRFEHVKEFGLNNIVPYIHIMETYYFLEYNNSKGINVSIDQFKNQYQEQHGKRITRANLIDKISNLRDAGLLNYEGGYISSEDDVTSQIESNGVVQA